MTDDAPRDPSTGSGETVADGATASRPSSEPARPSRRRETLADVLRRRTATAALFDTDHAVDLTGTPVAGWSPTTESASVREAGVRASLAAIMRSTGDSGIEPAAAIGVGTLLVDIPLIDLRENPFQPRLHFARQPLEELARSLADEGQIEPIIVRRIMRDGDSVLELVAGARRLAAARICDATIRPFPTLRAEIRTLTDDEAERISLVDNLQRENLTPLEEGYRYALLQRRDPVQWSVRAIADFVHKKKSTVQNRLYIVRDMAVAEAVLTEQIPPTAGFHIMRLPEAMRREYLAMAIAERRTVEQIRTEIDRRVASWRAAVPAPVRESHPDGDSQCSDAVDPGEPVSPMATVQRDLEGRRRRLEAQRAQLGLRIGELEAELRRHLVAYRELSGEIAATPPREASSGGAHARA